MSLLNRAETWKSRPSTKVWKDLRLFVGYQPGISDLTLPPIFGYVCDTLRDKYGIYVSVTPHVQTVTNDKEGEIENSFVFHFAGEVIVMKEMGKPTENIVYTGTNYTDVMLNCLTWVGKYLNDNK